MYKQAKYEEGVQRIQTAIDNIAGLDIAKDVDKTYLQSKLNQLGNNLKTVAAGDFSNFQLVNSINGMTNQLVKDSNVQNAVASTSILRKENQRKEKAIQDGKSSPGNEYFFNNQVGEYLNSSEIGQSFNGKYIEYFDIDKFAKETFDAVKPDEYSYDQIYQLGSDGRPMKDGRGNLIYSPTMTRLEKEGRFPPKVKATLEQIFSDPRVGQQLNITGQYNYRGLDTNQLVQKISSQRASVLSGYEDQLNDLVLKKSMGKDVQADIDVIESKIATVNSAYDSYVNLAFEDPKTVRGSLYKDDVNSRYTTMFGQMKEKTQVMENPGWNQNFKLQQEANEQSRFAQTLRQQKIAHKDDMDYKYTALAQAKELAIIAANAKGKGKTLGGGDLDDGAGPGGDPTEQAAQSAAIEIIRVQNAKFEEAASNFSNASDGFMWETIFSKIPKNDVTLKGLMNKGMKRDDAISLMINNAAKAAGQSPEQYKTHWANRATTEYNKLTPEEKAARPIISDTYHKYRDSKRIFDSEFIVKKKIDTQRQQELGEVGKKIAMTDFKPQTITWQDKKYTLTKDDILDLAIYKKGNTGILSEWFGGEDARALKQDSNMALSRLTKRGKAALAEAYLNDENMQKDEGFYNIVKGVMDLPNRIRYQSEGWGGTTRDWSQVKKAENIMNNQAYTEGIKKSAEIIQQHYNIAPNRNIDVMTGDNEIDRGTLAKLKRWGAEAVNGAGNLSPDYEDFNESLSNNPNENNIGARTIFDENNNPMVEVISYDSTGKRKAGITLQPDQATKIDIDLGTLYENKEASAARNKMNFNNNQTSAEDPSQTSTYISGDSWYDKTDFPGMKGNKNFDVQANIVYSRGKYYPFVYVSDGSKQTVKQLNGDENLENLLTALKTVVTPTFAKGLITTPN
jgi:hypothetical protein